MRQLQVLKHQRVALESLPASRSLVNNFLARRCCFSPCWMHSGDVWIKWMHRMETFQVPSTVITTFIVIIKRQFTSGNERQSDCLVSFLSFTGSNANRHQRYQRSNSFTSGVWRIDCRVEDLIQPLSRLADPLELSGLLQLARVAQKFRLLHQLDEQQRLKWIAGSSIPKIFVTGNNAVTIRWTTNGVNDEHEWVCLTWIYSAQQKAAICWLLLTGNLFSD